MQLESGIIELLSQLQNHLFQSFVSLPLIKWITHLKEGHITILGTISVNIVKLILLKGNNV